MGFSGRITTIVAPLVDERAERRQAAHVVALRAPYLLRRFAEIAAVLSTRDVQLSGGRILAERDAITGYSSAEFVTYGLRITFAAEGPNACLTWEAGSESGTQIVTADTLDLEIDSALFDAVSAFANTRPHRTTTVA